MELTPARAAWGLQVSSPDGKTTYKFESLTTSPYVPLTPSPTYVPHCRLSAFSNYPRIRVCNSLVLPCPPSLKCVDSPRTPLITIIRTELTSAVMLPLRRGTLRKRVHKCPIPSSPPPCSNHVCLGTAPQSLTHPATPLSGARDDSPLSHRPCRRAQSPLLSRSARPMETDQRGGKCERRCVSDRVRIKVELSAFAYTSVSTLCVRHEKGVQCKRCPMKGVESQKSTEQSRNNNNNINNNNKKGTEAKSKHCEIHDAATHGATSGSLYINGWVSGQHAYPCVPPHDRSVVA